MFDHLLFPVDGGDGVTATVDHVLDIAETHDATVHVLYVADTNEMSFARVQGDIVDAQLSEGETIVESIADRSRERELETVTEVQQGDPDKTIVEYASSRAVDLVVMPTQGRQKLERFLLGSTTERVLRRSEVPVLTVRPENDGIPDYPYESVLVATDGSDGANTALKTGIELAKTGPSALHVLSVVAVSGFGDEVFTEDGLSALETQAEQIVEEATTLATEAGVSDVSGAVDYGPSIHQEILSYVDKHDVSVIVAGTHGRTGLDRYLLGSVTEYLVRTAPVPVISVRGPTDEE